MSASPENGDFDLQAAEYVLGTLDHASRSALTEQLASDQAVRRAVAGWEARFAGLAGRVDAVAPAPQVWDRIERAITGQASATMHPFKVIDGGGSAQSGDVANSMRRSRDRWRVGALLSGALAAAMLILFTQGSLRTNAPPDTTYVAAVNRGGDKPALIVRVDLKTGQVLVRPVAASAPEGRSLELWYIGTDKTPRSMGIVEGAPSRLNLPDGVSDTATFAVSVEPKGGSKTGSPTGPVVYSGQLIKE